MWQSVKYLVHAISKSESIDQHKKDPHYENNNASPTTITTSASISGDHGDIKHGNALIEDQGLLVSDDYRSDDHSPTTVIMNPAVTASAKKGTIEYTRHYLEEIVTQTVKENLPACLKVISRAEEAYLRLFDSSIGHKQRSGVDSNGHYTPSCLISELRAILCRQYEDPLTEECKPISTLVNTEEKLQILCLYLLWTNENVVKTLSYSIGTHHHHTPHTHGHGQGHTFDEELPLTGRWNIFYQEHKRNSRHSHQFVLDLRYLHHNDLILQPTDSDFLSAAPSPVLNHKASTRLTSFDNPTQKAKSKTPPNALLRSNRRIVSSLVQSDTQHFDIGQSEEEVYVTFRDPSNAGKSDEVQALTVQLFCEYSLRQAQTLAHLLQSNVSSHKNVIQYVSIVLIQHDLTNVDLNQLAIAIPSLPKKKHHHHSPSSSPYQHHDDHDLVRTSSPHDIPPFPGKKQTLLRTATSRDSPLNFSHHSSTTSRGSHSSTNSTLSSCSEYEDEDDDEEHIGFLGFELKSTFPQLSRLDVRSL